MKTSYVNPEEMSDHELANALSDEADKQSLWNYTAQLYAEAALRIRSKACEA